MNVNMHLKALIVGSDASAVVLSLPPLLPLSFDLASLLLTLPNLSVPASRPQGAQMDTVIFHDKSDFQGNKIFLVVGFLVHF